MKHHFTTVRMAIMKKSAAAAKSLQLCLTLCDPIDGSPPGSPVPGTLQARVLEWGAIAFSNEVYKITNDREGVVKKEPHYTTGRNVNWYSHYGKQYGGSLQN